MKNSIFSDSINMKFWRDRKGKGTQEAVLARVEKAKRWSGLIESLALIKTRIACLIESSLVRGLPPGPVDFISTRDSGPMSMQNKMSSLLIRFGFRLYNFAVELSASTISISRCLSRFSCFREQPCVSSLCFGNEEGIKIHVVYKEKSRRAHFISRA